MVDVETVSRQVVEDQQALRDQALQPVRRGQFRRKALATAAHRQEVAPRLMEKHDHAAHQHHEVQRDRPIAEMEKLRGLSRSLGHHDDQWNHGTREQRDARDRPELVYRVIQSLPNLRPGLIG